MLALIEVLLIIAIVIFTVKIRKATKIYDNIKWPEDGEENYWEKRGEKEKEREKIKETITSNKVKNFILYICLFVSLLISAIVFSSYIGKEFSIDKKIQIAESYNSKIEEEFQSMIYAYQNFEKTTNESLKVEGEASVAMIVKYPTLSSSTHVQEQMDIYNKNRSEIRDLKLAKNSLAYHKLWLYFGQMQ